MLTSFELAGCDGIDASDVISIHALKSLQKLTLYGSCRLDESVRQSLTPPSPLLPNLTSFEYDAPLEEPEVEAEEEV